MPVEAALASRPRRGVVLGDEEVAEVERARRAVLRAEALGVQREQAGGEALPHHAAAAQLVQCNVHGRVLPVERAPALLRRVRLGLLQQRRALRFGQQPRHDLRQAEASRQRQRQAAGQSSLHPAGEPARRAAAMQSDESDCGSASHREPVVLWSFEHADQVVSDPLQAMPAAERVEHCPPHHTPTATSPPRARHGHPKAQHEGQRELGAIVGCLTLGGRHQALAHRVPRQMICKFRAETRCACFLFYPLPASNFSRRSCGDHDGPFAKAWTAPLFSNRHRLLAACRCAAYAGPPRGRGFSSTRAPRGRGFSSSRSQLLAAPRDDGRAEAQRLSGDDAGGVGSRDGPLCHRRRLT